MALPCAYPDSLNIYINGSILAFAIIFHNYVNKFQNLVCTLSTLSLCIHTYVLSI